MFQNFSELTLWANLKFGMLHNVLTLDENNGTSDPHLKCLGETIPQTLENPKSDNFWLLGNCFSYTMFLYTDRWQATDFSDHRGMADFTPDV